MGKQGREMEVQAAKRRRVMWALWSGGIVVVIILFIILAKVVSNSSGSTASTSSSPAPASLVTKVTGIPTSVFESVGQGTSTPLPKPISAPALSQNGKPRIVYLGAEYCPYCATERWPMVISLSRFGTFSNLGVTHSSSTDVFPSTQTFSFHGSTYNSQYVVFTPVEMQSNVLVGGSYAVLDTPTSEEQALLTKYDAPPYTSSTGGIPFIYFGGQYLISGSTYDPSVLQGKTADEIATALSDPSTKISQGAIGAANAITATICSMTGDQPGSVCSDSVIQALEKKISTQ